MKNIKKNAILNIGYQVILLLTPLITSPYLSRVLGADGIGTYSFIESIVTYFTMFATMGINIYGQREVSYVQDDANKRSIAFWNAKLLEFCTAGTAFVIYIIFSLTQKNPLNYLLFSFNILYVFFDITWFFQGMEDFSKIVTRNVIIKVLFIAFVFIFIKDKADLTLYIFGYAFSMFLSGVFLWPNLRKYLVKVQRSDLHPFRDIKVVLSLFLPNIAVQLYAVLDKTMIGLITKSNYENGYYEQAMRITRSLVLVVCALSTVVIPRIGALFEKGEKEQVKQRMLSTYRFIWFLGIPFCFGLILTAANFVPWFFGDGFEKTIPLLCILSLLIPIFGISNATGVQYLVPTKRQNTYTLTVIIGSVTNLILNIILISLFQAVGAAIASITAETVIMLTQLIFIRKEIGIREVFQQGIHYLFAGACMAIALIPMMLFLSSSFIHTILMVFAGCLVYVGVLILMKDGFFLENVRDIINKISSVSKKNESN